MGRRGVGVRKVKLSGTKQYARCRARLSVTTLLYTGYEGCCTYCSYRSRLRSRSFITAAPRRICPILYKGYNEGLALRRCGGNDYPCYRTKFGPGYDLRRGVCFYYAVWHILGGVSTVYAPRFTMCFTRDFFGRTLV